MKITKTELKELIREMLREELNKTKLNEKWETVDADWGPVKLWYSDSASEFRSFLQNVASTGIKGLRLSIADGKYLAARASDLNHDQIVEVAEDNYIIDGDESFEWSTCGFPKLIDFESDNFEGEDYDEDDLSWIEADKAREADKLASLVGKEYDIVDSATGEVHTFTYDGKPHVLVADCGTFEVELYNFYSKEFPAFKNGDGRYNKTFQLFETSATYFALKPLIKKLYMTNL